mmetsp:Transcript_20990/g.32550  ORF Transcript_20990/g.32550 Transcript_20990/m.32550 type:complete len:84 (-) Transcript_20990:1209-1460(-)
MSAMRARMRGRNSFILDRGTDRADDGSSPLNDISMTKSDLSGPSLDGRQFSSTSLMNSSVLSAHDRLQVIKNMGNTLSQQYST